MIAPNRRILIILLGVIGFIAFLSLFSASPSPIPAFPASSREPIHPVQVDDEVLKGAVISSKIGNETVKAELGRAAWRLLHTTMAKFPDKPTQDEQTALFSYIHLFARLYPCGECASHFRTILAKFPPQVSTRSSAAAWACHVHNEVNKSLKKKIFHCSKIGDFYDCGCAEEEGEGKGKKGEGQKGEGQKGAHDAHSSKAAAGSRIDLRFERMGKTAGG